MTRGNKKQYPPDVAVAWKGSYNTAKGSGTYLKVVLKEDLAAGTEIIAFPKARQKRNETDPDFGFALSTPRGAKAGGNVSSPRSTGRRAAPPALEDSADDGGDNGAIDF